MEGSIAKGVVIVLAFVIFGVMAFGASLSKSEPTMTSKEIDSSIASIPEE